MYFQKDFIFVDVETISLSLCNDESILITNYRKLLINILTSKSYIINSTSKYAIEEISKYSLSECLCVMS